MCGIAGLIDPVDLPSEACLRQMAGKMTCRGPDDEGILRQGMIGLTHRRLAIIDLTGGRQPIFNEDKSLALICNGEIYDFAALRNELINKGHHFSTHSDSEVILHLYEDMGEFCLDRLNGMFAFAIADFAKNAIFLARDRFGQKPLFFAESAHRFAFASGPAALAQLDWVDTTPDPVAIHDFLEYQYIPRPRSIFCGVRKLAPGHWLKWRCADGQKSAVQQPACIQPYWSPDLLPGFQGTFDDAAEEVSRLMTAAVSRRLVADVPLGAFLSGGMDSSIICALAQKSLSESGLPALKTFSIGFPVARYDEREYAETVAGHLNTDHHFLEVNPADFSSLQKVVSSFEEPFGDSSMLPTWLLSQFTRQHVTVGISGDGADELFGGYYRYRVMHLCRWLTMLPRGLRTATRKALLAVLPNKTEERTVIGKIRRLVELMDVDGLKRYLTLISRFPDELRQSLYNEQMRAAVGNHSGISFLEDHTPELGCPVDRIMELDCRTYMPEDILVKVDRASMAHGLEVRSPFLDPAVAECALSLPYHFKQQGKLRKCVLHKAFRKQLPEMIFTRPKMGFGMPVAHWIRTEWKRPVQDVLLSGTLDQYFRRERLECLLQGHCRKQADYSYSIFALTVLGLWLDGTN